jgi:regulator of replication initiation timing
MAISEDFIPENYEFNEEQADRPPIFINELPKPQDFIDDDEELEDGNIHRLLRSTPSSTNFSQFLENGRESVTNDSKSVTDSLPFVTATDEPVTDSLQVVTATDEPVTDSLQVVTATDEPVTNSLEIVTATDKPVTDSLEVVTTESKPVTDSLEVVTAESKPVTDSLEVVTAESKPVTDSLEVVTAESKPVTDSLGVVTTESKPVTDSIGIVTSTENSEVKKTLITNATPTSTVKVFTTSLDRFKLFFNTSGFRTLGDASAFVFENFESVFDVEDHIAQLNRMTLERNQLKQQVDEGFNENDKEVFEFQSRVADYQKQIISLTNERDEAKRSLGQLVERNIEDNQTKEATSAETWQEERKTLIAQFTAEYKQGFQQCQDESFGTCQSFYDYAISNAVHLMYEDTRKLHKGTGFFKTSAIRTEADFYTMFKMYVQQYYDHAQKIKETETLQNPNQ